jgi:hypothetical protein
MVGGLLGAALAPAAPKGTVQIRLDTSEADAVLAILALREHHQPIPDAEWSRLFASTPFKRLEAREAAIAKMFAMPRRTLDRNKFRAFVESDSLLAQAPALRRTLADWQRADVRASATRVLAWLPAGARIHATVYPVIKPASNSFVYDTAHDPAIFLYLDPTLSRAHVENTIAHECHHIGFASISARRDSIESGRTEDARAALDWASAFGEGFAMLAAAGSPDVHPKAVCPPSEIARWDADIARFDEDLARVQSFLLDAAEGRLHDAAVRDSIGSSFFGEQGPWYTVGWAMASRIARDEGREQVIACMLDPAAFFESWNRVAEAHDRAGTEHMARWSPELIEALRKRR